MTDPKAEQQEPKRWQVHNGYLESPIGRVMAQETETVACLHDLAAILNRLRCEGDYQHCLVQALEEIRDWQPASTHHSIPTQRDIARAALDALQKKD